MRGRSNNRKPGNSRNQSFESNGPEVRVRGNAQQVVEKYLALARDATVAGDHITAEGYYQHAEHYYRLMTADGGGEHRSRQPADQQSVDYGDQPQPMIEADAFSGSGSTDAGASNGSVETAPANGSDEAAGDGAGEKPQSEAPSDDEAGDEASA